jgi:hypothetical protein
MDTLGYHPADSAAVAETIPIRRASYLDDFLDAIRGEVATKSITEDWDLHETIAAAIVKYCGVKGVSVNDGALVLNAGHLAFAILADKNAQPASCPAPVSLAMPLDGRRARSRFQQG